MGLKLRRAASVCLGISLVFSSLGYVSANNGSVVKDYEGHWAQKQIESWLKKGWLKGFEDGSVKPNQSITRAEFVTLVNRFFEVTKSQPVNFTDLPTTGWVYEEFSKAASLGYINGYGDKVRPNDPVTRQEAAVIFSKLLLMEGEDPAVLDQFKDRDQIAAWSESKVAGMINSGIMKGYPSGNFSPKQAMTRAEAVAIMESLNRSVGGEYHITQSGVVGSKNPLLQSSYENVTVSTYGVTIQNAIVYGDLLLDEGIGEGDVYLDNVTVKGNVVVRGGGADSIHLKNSTLERMILQKKSGAVRIVTEGTTRIINISVQSLATLQLGQGTTVTKIILDAVTKVTGQGQILSATLNDGAKGSTFEKSPDQINGSQKDSLSSPAPTATSPVAIAPGGSSGGGGGSGGSGGEIPTTSPTPTPTPTPTPVVNIPVVDGIAVVQDAVYRYTNAATITIKLSGLPSAIYSKTDHAEYYFTTIPEESLDMEKDRGYFPSGPMITFPVDAENVKDYMTIILFDGNNEPIGYKTIKLDLSVKYTTLDMSTIAKYTEGVNIIGADNSQFISTSIFLTPTFLQQHPDVKYFTTTSNTVPSVIVDLAKDFNVEHISTTVEYLNEKWYSAHDYSYENFDDYNAPFYTQPNFVEEYMVILYDSELKVLGYYQSPAHLTDQQQADIVAYKIRKLPAVELLNLDDELAVNWAYNRYQNLTEDQKKLLDEALVNKVIEAKAKILLLKQG